MSSTAAAKGSWLSRLRRGLAYLCCLLSLTLGAPEAARGAWAAGPPPATGEGEERPSNDENDDGKDNEPGKRGEEGLARHGRSARPARAAPSGARLAHRPHDHCPLAGHPLPVCSPFERGALLPLRC
jgi:hypothetical protein